MHGEVLFGERVVSPVRTGHGKLLTMPEKRLVPPVQRIVRNRLKRTVSQLLDRSVGLPPVPLHLKMHDLPPRKVPHGQRHLQNLLLPHPRLLQLLQSQIMSGVHSLEIYHLGRSLPQLFLHRQRMRQLHHHRKMQIMLKMVVFAGQSDLRRVPLPHRRLSQLLLPLNLQFLRICLLTRFVDL